MQRKVFFGQNLILVLLLLGQLHGYKSCIQEESKALWELKKYLISKSEQGSSVFPEWTNDTKRDCCRWKGVECNRTSGRVIGISFGNTMLKEGTLLNLSLLHPFEEVRTLNFSWEGRNRFSGFFDDVEGSKSLRRLTNLEILDLSTNDFSYSIFPFINAATSLTNLFFRINYMDGPFPFRELKNLTNLELLDLSQSGFNGSISEISHLKKLKALDLSYNDIRSSIEVQELNNLTNMEVLSLAGSLSIPIPIEVICEMKNLRELDLSGNDFDGQLPPCLGSLTKLRVLDLSNNQFSGNLPSSFSSLESLEYLSLLDNNFTSLFSLNPLTNLTKLKVFKLSSTSDVVLVETETSWQPKFQLSVVVLSLCSLEKIPSFLVYQKKLRLVDLSGNKLSGNIPTWLLENNPELEVLQLQTNSFTIFHMPTAVHNLQVLDVSTNDLGGLFPDNVSRALPYLKLMNASSNVFQGHFPSAMGEMKNITFLDLSYNNFSGTLPRSFFMSCFSLKFLKLSHNKFSSHFLPRGTNITALRVLRMDNNLFSGSIRVDLLSTTNLSVLDISNNRLTGAIPSWISKLSRLSFLLLSNNLLEGTIPPSLLLMARIWFLDLSGNHFSGSLPSHVNSTSGRHLFLQNNNFSGPIPNTFLENVQMLDLRNNKLSGVIPQFVNTHNMQIILLKGNNLTGSIPRQLCDLRDIRLLDLSYNKLNGNIPSCLYNLSFGPRGDKDTGIYSPPAFFLSILQLEFYISTFFAEELTANYFNFQEIEIKFRVKQRYDSYIGISAFSDGILGYMYGMDLSHNELTGVMPTEIGDLWKLRALNLSHNFLSGYIPSSFSSLKDIESIDFSHNMLHGSIPYQLTSLTSLAVFDVSYNNLSGIIPQGKQFNTFNENNYIGNPLLCGPPTNRSCEAKNSFQADDGGQHLDDGGENLDDESNILVFYVSIASTYVTVLIGIVLLMCFDCPWRRAWLRIVDAFIASTKNMLS